MLLSVDIGRTAARMSLLDSDGNMMERARYSVNYDGYQTPILQTALVRTRDFLDRTGGRPEGIAISAVGQIDMDTGSVAGMGDPVPNWVGAGLRQAFEDAFAVPTVVINDANSAVLGEQWRGAARGLQDVVMVNIGSGIGAGIMVGGQVLFGRNGLAGEVGHMPLYADGLPCACGNRGCWEQYASINALLRRMGQAVPGEDWDAREVFKLAAAGAKPVLTTLLAWLEDVAMGLVGLVHAFNPQMLVIGGPITTQKSMLVAPLRERVMAKAMPRYREGGLRVEAEALSGDAGMIGAARYWLDNSL